MSLSGYIVAPSCGLCHAHDTQIKATGNGWRCRDRADCKRRAARPRKAAKVVLLPSPEARAEREAARRRETEAAFLAQVLDKGAHFTLDEIGEQLGITKQAVEKIERRALIKANRAARLMGLRLEDIVG